MKKGALVGGNASVACVIMSQDKIRYSGTGMCAGVTEQSWASKALATRAAIHYSTS